MGRAPCCEKMGLKKGPWTKEEDHLLITYINQNGHQNWRALPKKAGLLRCGKSCRLRWINYLRPDIKRGNFSKEEEDTIIQLHQVLGNRWSAIAARLPGRTDNEIKNIWHTHLKKKLVKQAISETQVQQVKKVKYHDDGHADEDDQSRNPESSGSMQLCQPNSPSHSSSSSDVSSSITTATNHENNAHADMSLTTASLHSHPNLEEDFSWLDVVSSENSEKFSDEDELYFPLSPLHDYSSTFNSSSTNEDLDFWSNIFTKSEELLEVPEF